MRIDLLFRAFTKSMFNKYLHFIRPKAQGGPNAWSKDNSENRICMEGALPTRAVACFSLDSLDSFLDFLAQFKQAYLALHCECSNGWIIDKHGNKMVHSLLSSTSYVSLKQYNANGVAGTVQAANVSR